MSKGFLVAALLMITGSAFGADLSSVGTTGVEAVADYSYVRSIDTSSYSADHTGLAGLQLNGGVLGSVAVEAGDTQRVGDFRLNYSQFSVTYANGLKLGSVNVVGDVSYSNNTGDKWFFSGKNSSLPVNNASIGGEVNAPLAGPVRLFADYNHTYTWSGNVNSFYTNAVQVTSANGDQGVVGAYVDLSKHLVVKAGYVRNWENGNGQGLLVSAGYRF